MVGWMDLGGGEGASGFYRPSHIAGEVMPTSRDVGEKERGMGGDGFKARFHPEILLQPHLPSSPQTPSTKTTCVVNSIHKQKASSICSCSN